jgi:hypothetical protein
LDIPANAVCKLVGSGYGSAYWNRACTPETLPVTLIVTVKGASSSKTEVDFQPAMRFNPDKNVSLFFYAPKVSKQDAKNWTILYCGSRYSGEEGKKCVNEAQSDQSLQTYIDYQNSILFRRIKHFSAYRVDDSSSSGYVVAE